MFRPQVLEAVFVAGCIFVGMTGPVLKWDKFAAISQREMSFGYEFISAVESVTRDTIMLHSNLPPAKSR